jgi:hypothetical protein
VYLVVVFAERAKLNTPLYLSQKVLNYIVLAMPFFKKSEIIFYHLPLHFKDYKVKKKSSITKIPLTIVNTNLNELLLRMLI